VYTEDNEVDYKFSDVNVEEQIPLEEHNTIDDQAYVDYLILETAQRTFNGRVLQVCTVQWNNETEEDATWEKGGSNEDRVP
jgi:hypothetical protein